MKSVVSRCYLFIYLGDGQVHSSCLLNCIGVCSYWYNHELLFPEQTEVIVGRKSLQACWNRKWEAEPKQCSTCCPPLFHSLTNIKRMHDNPVQNVLSPLELRRREESGQAGLCVDKRVRLQPTHPAAQAHPWLCTRRSPAMLTLEKTEYC